MKRAWERAYIDESHSRFGTDSSLREGRSYHSKVDIYSYSVRGSS